MSAPKILAFAGSARKDSWNKKLILAAADAARAAGADVTLVDLADFPMPLYDGDLESGEGQPEHAKRLRQIMLEHDGLLLCCPEYNSGITPLLKNTIDWVSRNEEGKGSLTPYEGKVCGLLAASPGALGGLRGLVQVRSILGNIGVIVLPQQYALSQAHNAFDADGKLTDEKALAATTKVATAVVETLKKLKG